MSGAADKPDLVKGNGNGRREEKRREENKHAMAIIENLKPAPNSREYLHICTKNHYCMSFPLGQREREQKKGRLKINFRKCINEYVYVKRV